MFGCVVLYRLVFYRLASHRLVFRGARVLRQSVCESTPFLSPITFPCVPACACACPCVPVHACTFLLGACSVPDPRLASPRFASPRIELSRSKNPSTVSNCTWPRRGGHPWVSSLPTSTTCWRRGNPAVLCTPCPAVMDEIASTVASRAVWHSSGR